MEKQWLMIEKKKKWYQKSKNRVTNFAAKVGDAE